MRNCTQLQLASPNLPKAELELRALDMTIAQMEPNAWGATSAGVPAKGAAVGSGARLTVKVEADMQVADDKATDDCQAMKAGIATGAGGAARGATSAGILAGGTDVGSGAVPAGTAESDVPRDGTTTGAG